MPRLPPAAKLPLALRKSIRDDFDAKKEDVEKKLSDVLGTAWTIEADPLAIFPYADNAYPKENLGRCMTEYFTDASRRLEERKEEERTEINNIASKHVLELDVDENSKVSYCGCEIVDGKLRIIFNPKYLGSNIAQALEASNVDKAMNEAIKSSGSADEISFTCKNDMRQNYDPFIEEVQRKIAGRLNYPDIKLIPNFEENYAKLKAESQVKNTNLIKYWDESLGRATLSYFKGLESQLEWQKFTDDELMQEGFAELVTKGEVAIRIVDKLNKSSYSEAAIEDGVLCINVLAPQWYSNVDNAAENLTSLL